ncbi:putative NUDIX hydrolase [Candidatus Terasakiella magnetica]|uniref:Putative NUDIX hydrolase n=1 Tax=Candidatus Terasakiella magnetica TaxID=1867952 RepID=A0A1C3RKM3_9PROT|nr:hypothetical protein [Candidatus Terasakiella magnetica]SCA57872.1 putative NUDIX hydrolase [Candidatus Terasakiella magnetica]
MIEWYDLNEDVALALVDPPEIDEETQTQVGLNWEGELKANPNLTKGPIYALDKITPEVIRLYQTDYSYVLAARKIPKLDISAMAVTGLTICPEGLVLGRRSSLVVNTPNLWEPAPAGGLSQLDLHAQLFEELEEELGLTSKDCARPKVIGGVYDGSTFDVVLSLKTALSFSALEGIFQSSSRDEYDAIRLLPFDQFDAFLQKETDSSLEILPVILKEFQKLNN